MYNKRKTDKIMTEENSLDNLLKNIGYYAKYYYKGLYQGKKIYQLHEKMQSFLVQKFSTPVEQKKAHVNLLWKLKKFYFSPFQKEAISLVNNNAAYFQLTDKDKLTYLNFLLSTKIYSQFSEKFYQNLSLFDLTDKVKQNQALDIWNKMRECVEKKQKNPDENKKIIQLFFPFIKNLSEKISCASYKLIGDYTEFFFKTSERFPEYYISLHPLYLLTTKTHSALAQKSPRLFEDNIQSSSKHIDYLAVINIAKAYRAYVLNHAKKRKVNHNLDYAMEQFLTYVVKNHDYRPRDVKNLTSALGEKYEQHPNLIALKKNISKVYNQHRYKNMSLYPLLVKGKKANDII